MVSVAHAAPFAYSALLATLLGSLTLMLCLIFRPPTVSRHRAWRYMVTNRPFGVLAIGFLALWVSVLLYRIAPHTPAVTDEYAYLLASQTFSAGHLTNPQHPFWRILKPSMSSTPRRTWPSIPQRRVWRWRPGL